MSCAHPRHAVGPLVAPAQLDPGAHVGMVRPAIVADEKALVLVRPRRLVHGRGALHRGVHRQVADVVPVQPQREFFVHRQRVEAARRGEPPVDHLLRHAMIERVEEPDMLAGVPHLDRHPGQRAGLAGEGRPEIDHRDLRRRLRVVPHRVLLEEMHRSPPIPPAGASVGRGQRPVKRAASRELLRGIAAPTQDGAEWQGERARGKRRACSRPAPALDRGAGCRRSNTGHPRRRGGDARRRDACPTPRRWAAPGFA